MITYAFTKQYFMIKFVIYFIAFHYSRFGFCCFNYLSYADKGNVERKRKGRENILKEKCGKDLCEKNRIYSTFLIFYFYIYQYLS